MVDRVERELRLLDTICSTYLTLHKLREILGVPVIFSLYKNLNWLFLNDYGKNRVWRIEYEYVYCGEVILYPSLVSGDEI